MMLLYQGDKRPVVTTMQKLLGGLTCDGDFGPATATAVRNFQRANSLTPDGIVGPRTWSKLMILGDKLTVDVVDGTDPSLLQYEGADITAAGGRPIVYFGMSNGIEQMVQDVINRVGRNGRLALLRLHSHGAPGAMNISAGHENMDAHMSSLAASTLGYSGPILDRLGPYFMRAGSMELMGCNVGQGAQGRQLLDGACRRVMVPVTAAVLTQYGGGNDTWRFEGPIRTGYPYGGSLKGWSREAAAV